ncbi:hypothetical protein [Aureliella helgolandensis]|uniref:PEP-CTERM protein-sorting domain-containing protein n=1 Tax=Aureliella helgolandensis TaxID=2527968 RepID=A0A518G3A7_9BACT|nr:hypothetical protein [Aureliella helgolandensis]QDV23083.1 hypothetical protein Q31a_13780 [Aureliella helgolandensis]
MYCNLIKVTCPVLLLFLATQSLEAQEFFAPTEYRAFDDANAGAAVSPFRDLEFDLFYLEDFEDGLLNTPGVSLLEFATTGIGTSVSDSVDGDDGTIDGFATGISRSLFSSLSTSSFTFEFDRSELGGQLPTHVGIVWTDVGSSGGGVPNVDDLIDNTTFEAFDRNGDSFGLKGAFSLGDASISRTTEEDRFIGFASPEGISSFRIAMPGSDNWEVDHLQYGVTSVPEPASMVILWGATLCFGFRRVRRHSRA